MSTVSNAASVFSPSQINTTSSSSSSSTSSTAQAAGANASQQLAGNFNTFLQLLTTQLQTRIRSIRSIPISLRSSWSNLLRSSSRST